MGSPVSGITLIKHIEANMCPLVIHLNRGLLAKVVEFFSLPDAETERRRARSMAKAKASFIPSLAGQGAQPTSVSGRVSGSVSSSVSALGRAVGLPTLVRNSSGSGGGGKGSGSGGSEEEDEDGGDAEGDGGGTNISPSKKQREDIQVTTKLG